MKKRIHFAGNILLDIVKRIDAWPQKGMLVNISESTRAVGGSVCNSGIDLKTLDPSVDVVAYGRVGADEYGDWVCRFMKDRGLDISHIRRDETAPTSYTDVMTVDATGERTFFHARGANAAFCADDVDLAELTGDLFHLGYLLLLDALDAPDAEYGTCAARLLHDVQAKGIKTSIDLVSDQSGRFETVVPPALKYCNYLIINEVEGGMLAGIAPRDAEGRIDTDACKSICTALLGLGVQDAVVIHCPELSCAMRADGSFVIEPSLALPKGYIRGSVGAGDAFCAGMLYAFLNDMPLSDGMQLAACAAACNLAVSDSVSGAKSYLETIKLSKLYGRRTKSC